MAESLSRENALVGRIRKLLGTDGKEHGSQVLRIALSSLLAEDQHASSKLVSRCLDVWSIQSKTSEASSEPSTKSSSSCLTHQTSENNAPNDSLHEGNSVPSNAAQGHDSCPKLQLGKCDLEADKLVLSTKLLAAARHKGQLIAHASVTSSFTRQRCNPASPKLGANQPKKCQSKDTLNPDIVQVISSKTELLAKAAIQHVKVSCQGLPAFRRRLLDIEEGRADYRGQFIPSAHFMEMERVVRSKPHFPKVHSVASAMDLGRQKRQASIKTTNQGILLWHEEVAAEALRKLSEAALLRINALKSSDMQGYLEMIKNTKNDQLQSVLQQTDACLRSLAKKLGLGQTILDIEKTAVNTSGTQELPGLLESSDIWSQLASKLQADIETQPSLIEEGELREYQMQGLRWLVALHDNGLNGILADEMGLGKTLQVISMISFFVESRASKAPFMVVAPASVISSWSAEFEKWAPKLNVIVYRGSPDARVSLYYEKITFRRGTSPRFHVLLTTYEYLMKPTDRQKLSNIHWHHIVVDEGHRLKNSNCKLSTEMRGYKSSSRLLLTGTPLQNHIQELWSLLNFLMPALFADGDEFAKWFSAPLEVLKSTSAGSSSKEGLVEECREATAKALSQEEYLLVTNRLHMVLRPFMLRRLKETVTKELPEKIEHLLQCGMSAYQASLVHMVQRNLAYEAKRISQPDPSDISGGLDPLLKTEKLSGPSLRLVNNICMEMRNICNHPFASRLHSVNGEAWLEPHPEGLPHVITLSGKMDVLDRLLLKLRTGGHKVLLFCTMTRILDIIEELLDWRGFGFQRLDGSTPSSERGAIIQEFNEDPDCFVFLLSLKAGGVGLNLQAADTVIMYDTDWNPALDLQAQARAHRLGQTKQVTVLRLVTKGSVEEHIIKVAAEKRKFADSSITGGFFDNETSAEERKEYLLSILTQPVLPSASNSENGDCTFSNKDLNQLLARSPTELDILEASDAKQYKASHPPGQVKDCPGVDLSHEGQGQGGSLSDLPENNCIPYNRVLGADACAMLINEVSKAITIRDEDEGKVFGRGLRTINAIQSQSSQGSAQLPDPASQPALLPAPPAPSRAPKPQPAPATLPNLVTGPALLPAPSPAPTPIPDACAALLAQPTPATLPAADPATLPLSGPAPMQASIPKEIPQKKERMNGGALKGKHASVGEKPSFTVDKDEGRSSKLLSPRNEILKPTLTDCDTGLQIRGQHVTGKGSSLCVSKGHKNLAPRIDSCGEARQTQVNMTTSADCSWFAVCGVTADVAVPLVLADGEAVVQPGAGDEMRTQLNMTTSGDCSWFTVHGVTADVAVPLVLTGGEAVVQPAAGDAMSSDPPQAAHELQSQPHSLAVPSAYLATGAPFVEPQAHMPAVTFGDPRGLAPATHVEHIAAASIAEPEDNYLQAHHYDLPLHHKDICLTDMEGNQGGGSDSVNDPDSVNDTNSADGPDPKETGSKSVSKPSTRSPQDAGAGSDNARGLSNRTRSSQDAGAGSNNARDVSHHTRSSQDAGAGSDIARDLSHLTGNSKDAGAGSDNARDVSHRTGNLKDKGAGRGKARDVSHQTRRSQGAGAGRDNDGDLPHRTRNSKDAGADSDNARDVSHRTRNSKDKGAGRGNARDESHRTRSSQDAGAGNDNTRDVSHQTRRSQGAGAGRGTARDVSHRTRKSQDTGAGSDIARDLSHRTRESGAAHGVAQPEELDHIPLAATSHAQGTKKDTRTTRKQKQASVPHLEAPILQDTLLEVVETRDTEDTVSKSVSKPNTMSSQDAGTGSDEAKDISHRTHESGAVEDVPTTQHGSVGAVEDVPTAQLGSVGAVEDVPTAQLGSVGAVEDVPTAQLGSVGAVEDVPTAQLGSVGAAEDVPTTQHGSVGAVEDVPTTKHGSVGAVEDVPTTKHDPVGAVEDVPTTKHGSVGAVEDVPTIQHGSVGAVEDVPTTQQRSAASTAGPANSLKNSTDQDKARQQYKTLLGGQAKVDTGSGSNKRPAFYIYDGASAHAFNAKTVTTSAPTAITQSSTHPQADSVQTNVSSHPTKDGGATHALAPVKEHNPVPHTVKVPAEGVNKDVGPDEPHKPVSVLGRITSSLRSLGGWLPQSGASHKRLEKQKDADAAVQAPISHKRQEEQEDVDAAVQAPKRNKSQEKVNAAGQAPKSNKRQEEQEDVDAAVQAPKRNKSQEKVDAVQAPKGYKGQEKQKDADSAVQAPKYQVGTPAEMSQPQSQTQSAKADSSRSRDGARKVDEGTKGSAAKQLVQVGQEITVWWPMDKTSYPGKVVKCEPLKKKAYTVKYGDGEEERIDLEQERWSISHKRQEKQEGAHAAVQAQKRHKGQEKQKDADAAVQAPKSQKGQEEQEDVDSAVQAPKRQVITPAETSQPQSQTQSAKADSSRIRDGARKGDEGAKGSASKQLVQVGQAIAVWWPEDNKSYPGKVVKYEPSKKKAYTVKYDDGEEERVDLEQEKWSICPPKQDRNAPLSKKRRFI
eukprot:gene10150-8053_t